MNDIFGRLAEASMFSKLVANMGFWQIPLMEDSVKYTTFIKPVGYYYLKTLHFVIASAP